MKYLIPFLVLLLSGPFAEARKSSGYGYGTGSSPRSHYVRPHIRHDGKYVAPHRKTNPDSNKLNNYDTRGNYNPYTGKTGDLSPNTPPAIK